MRVVLCLPALFRPPEVRPDEIISEPAHCNELLAVGPERAGRTARGVSPGAIDQPQQSPVRAAQASASPLQGSVLVYPLFPGLAPWAVL